MVVVQMRTERLLPGNGQNYQGPSAVIVNATSAGTAVNGLTAGSYPICIDSN